MKIYLSFYSHKGPTVVSWKTGGEKYTQRKNFFAYLLPRARECQNLHPLAAVSSETPLIGCVSLARIRFSALCLNLTAWFSSCGLLPVTHLLYPTALIVLPCLLITAWQLVKAHGVTRNEPKIHGTCYITTAGLSCVRFWAVSFSLILCDDETEKFVNITCYTQQSENTYEVTRGINFSNIASKFVTKSFIRWQNRRWWRVEPTIRFWLTLENSVHWRHGWRADVINRYELLVATIC